MGVRYIIFGVAISLFSNEIQTCMTRTELIDLWSYVFSPSSNEEQTQFESQDYSLNGESQMFDIQNSLQEDEDSSRKRIRRKAKESFPNINLEDPDDVGEHSLYRYGRRIINVPTAGPRQSIKELNAGYFEAKKVFDHRTTQAPSLKDSETKKTTEKPHGEGDAKGDTKGDEKKEQEKKEEGQEKKAEGQEKKAEGKSFSTTKAPEKKPSTTVPPITPP